MSKKRLVIKVGGSKAAPKDTVLVSRTDSTVESTVSPAKYDPKVTRRQDKEIKALSAEIIKLKVEKD
ncbi:hypothetical protein PF672P2_00003 [Parabacteroides phage PF672P2]|nr:hypothetical protein PF672P1_00041 [Parabacteroides phage PF672P1]WAX17140.1 hypothetical protein PF672P2_00003 [Parabacteroides phage PF672P2]